MADIEPRGDGGASSALLSIVIVSGGWGDAGLPTTLCVAEVDGEDFATHLNVGDPEVAPLLNFVSTSMDFDVLCELFSGETDVTGDNGT